MRAYLAIPFAVLLALGAPSRARAADASATAELDAEMVRATAALASADCASACRALASMQRAASHLCALDPGPPCASARAKVEDIARRVRAACTCPSSGADDAPPPVQAADAPKKSPAPAQQPAPQPATVRIQASAPPEPAAPRHGGCASCTLDGERSSRESTAALVASALAALALVRRRRRDP